MAQNFKAGDKVRHIAGGPTMAVESVDLIHVHCSWFAGTKLERATFSPAVLEPAPPSRKVTKRKNPRTA